MEGILRRGAVLACLIATAAAAQDGKVLFLTHSAGYEHEVVKRPAPGALSLAETELTAILKGRFVVEATKDCSVLAAGTLRGCRAVVFYTTGELPAPSDAVRDLVAYVRSGGGFVGIHCATDTWYGQPAYAEMIGGWFDGHPWHQPLDVMIEAPFGPGPCGTRTWRVHDEIYQFKAFSRVPLHVLASLDVRSVDASKGTRADRDYALAWRRDFGAGRVFYTALGHREEVWKDPEFRQQLASGVAWAAGGADWQPCPPPGRGAVALLPGAGGAAFTHRDGSPQRWKGDGGLLEVVPGTGDVVSRERFRDFRLHLEFRVPAHPPEDQGQARGNSGVYLQDRYEVQVLDSFGVEPRAGDCGAIYGKAPPATNASRPAGVWQTYDVEFRAARFDATGRKTENARVTVFQNGLRIHADVPIDGPTGGGEPETDEPGPIRLQDHGNLVAYRNLWVVPAP
jgi:type 1 glutamine amidotransferase